MLGGFEMSNRFSFAIIMREVFPLILLVERKRERDRREDRADREDGSLQA